MALSNAFPQALGLKLLLTWRQEQARGELPDFPGGLYRFLRDCGFHFVELATGPCVTQDEVDLLLGEAVACRDAGLALAIHPYLRGPHNPAHFGLLSEPDEALSAMLRAASAAPATIVLHPAEARCDPGSVERAPLRAELLQRSRLFFAEAERRIAASHPGVTLIVEHQLPTRPDEPVIRIGDTCAELLDSVAGTALGLCWDTGHYWLGVERYGQPDPPPAAFVSRVRHVHLHDVVAGTDHRIVRPESARVRGYMDVLQRSGFRGTVTLEYAWDAIQSSGGIEKVAREAAGILAGWGVA